MHSRLVQSLEHFAIDTQTLPQFVYSTKQILVHASSIGIA